MAEVPTDAEWYRALLVSRAVPRAVATAVCAAAALGLGFQPPSVTWWLIAVAVTGLILGVVVAGEIRRLNSRVLVAEAVPATVAAPPWHEDLSFGVVFALAIVAATVGAAAVFDGDAPGWVSFVAFCLWCMALDEAAGALAVAWIERRDGVRLAVLEEPDARQVYEIPSAATGRR